MSRHSCYFVSPSTVEAEPRINNDIIRNVVTFPALCADTRKQLEKEDLRDISSV